MKISTQATDAAVLDELGERLKRNRLELNLTQDQLAQEAGISRATVARLERGESAQLTSLIRLLRYLGLLDALDRLVPEPLPSPMDSLRRSGQQRQRARPEAAKGEEDVGEPRQWHWGDELERP